MDETFSGEEICTFDATTATFSITASAELSANDVYLATFQGSSGDNGENIGTLLYDCTVQAAPLTLLTCVYHSEGSSAGSVTSFSLNSVVNNGNSFAPDQSKIPKITIKTTTNPVVSSSPSEITKLTDTITVTFVAGTTDQCSKIFEPYYTTKADGTGLGLTTVYKIIKEFKGDINVQSELNKGTIFTISIPVPQKETKLLEEKAN